MRLKRDRTAVRVERGVRLAAVVLLAGMISARLPALVALTLRLSIRRLMGSRLGHVLPMVGRGPHDAFQTGFDNRLVAHRTPIIQNLATFETTSQMTAPSRWMATQWVIFLATSIGSTRQCIMKVVPSFL